MKKYILFITFFYAFIFSRDCFKVHQSLDRSGSYLDEFKISESGWFKVHYDIEGSGIATSAYVDEVLYIADSIRYILKDVMGYQDPPLANNDDPYYHIFLKSNYNYADYGATYTGNYLFGELIPSGASYIEIDNNYETYPVHNGLDPIVTMRETLAHEYFHAIQLGYRLFSASDKYFFELSSMWFEDLVVPDGNDWAMEIWTDPLIENHDYPFEWNTSFAVSSAGWGYALGLFGHYLSKVVDTKGVEDERHSTIMREIWELYGFSQANDAFDAVRTVTYENYDQSMHSIWLDFMSKNLFNSIEGSEFHYFEDQQLVDPLEIDLETISSDVDLEMTLNNKSVKILGYNTLNKCLIELEHSSNDFIGNIVKLEGSGSLTSIQNGIDFLIESAENAFFIYSTENINSVNIELSLDLNFVPTSPSNVFVFQSSHNEIEVFWETNFGNDGDVNFNIYRNGNKINEFEISDLEFKDTNFESSTTYSYTVTSFNDFGESESSYPISITTWPGIEDIEYNVFPYPNPCQNNLNLLLDSTQDHGNEIGHIYNIKGQRVRSFFINVKEGRQRHNINKAILGLSTGKYFLGFDNKYIPGAPFFIIK